MQDAIKSSMEAGMIQRKGQLAKIAKIGILKS
jgi:hypothetical protein